MLDLGAGAGYMGSAVRNHVSRLTGVDSDPLAASSPGAAAYDRWITARLAPDLEVGGAFDVILCADVLEHLPSPDEMMRAVRGWLRPGGAILVSVPNVANVTVRLALLAGRFSYSSRGLLDRTHLRFFTRHSAIDFVTECGFRVQRVTATAMPVELAVPILGRPPLRAVCRAVTLAAARLWPALFGYQFVIEARPR